MLAVAIELAATREISDDIHCSSLRDVMTKLWKCRGLIFDFRLYSRDVLTMIMGVILYNTHKKKEQRRSQQFNEAVNYFNCAVSKINDQVV